MTYSHTPLPTDYLSPNLPPHSYPSPLTTYPHTSLPTHHKFSLEDSVPVNCLKPFMLLHILHTLLHTEQNQEYDGTRALPPFVNCLTSSHTLSPLPPTHSLPLTLVTLHFLLTYIPYIPLTFTYSTSHTHTSLTSPPHHTHTHVCTHTHMHAHTHTHTHTHTPSSFQAFVSHL